MQCKSEGSSEVPPPQHPKANYTKREIMLLMDVAANQDLSRITVIAGQRSGQPCIRGLRVTVWDILDMLAAGMTKDEILQDYPYLGKADFPAVYAYAVRVGRDHAAR